MQRQSQPRAGNHQRRTHTRNASLPTQANHTVRGARKQPPNQGAIHAASEDTTHTSNHTACHQGRKRRPARHPPRAQHTPITTIASLCNTHSATQPTLPQHSRRTCCRRPTGGRHNATGTRWRLGNKEGQTRPLPRRGVGNYSSWCLLGPDTHVPGPNRHPCVRSLFRVEWMEHVQCAFVLKNEQLEVK